MARTHHYVARCYLKGFAVQRRKKKPQITVFDGKDRKVFIAAVDNVALERDFNRVEIEGLEPDSFENAMAGFEGEIGSYGHCTETDIDPIPCSTMGCAPGMTLSAISSRWSCMA